MTCAVCNVEIESGVICGQCECDRINQERRMVRAHAGDCTIYAALINGSPTDGICTCGYGWTLVRTGDWSEMYSKERLSSND